MQSTEQHAFPALQTLIAIDAIPITNVQTVYLDIHLFQATLRDVARQEKRGVLCQVFIVSLVPHL